jgi:glucose-1-phosphate thymidylyltransferase
LTSPPRPLLGLIPAAGSARRLGRLPCSKELLPIGVAPGAQPAVRVLADQLLDSFAAAGVGRALVVLDPAKLDLLRFLGAARDRGPRLAFVAAPASASVPATLDAAYPFLAGSTVVLGFPDVLFAPGDACARLLARQRETDADLMLGLFPAADCRTTDMVDVASDGRVLAIEVRPRESRLAWNWLLAVWAPRFSDFLHDSVRQRSPAAEEAQLGEVFRAALTRGLAVQGVVFPAGRWLDAGTPAGLAAALRHGGLPPREPAPG